MNTFLCLHRFPFDSLSLEILFQLSHCATLTKFPKKDCVLHWLTQVIGRFLITIVILST